MCKVFWPEGWKEGGKEEKWKKKNKKNENKTAQSLQNDDAVLLSTSDFDLEHFFWKLTQKLILINLQL